MVNANLEGFARKPKPAETYGTSGNRDAAFGPAQRARCGFASLCARCARVFAAAGRNIWRRSCRRIAMRSVGALSLVPLHDVALAAWTASLTSIFPPPRFARRDGAFPSDRSCHRAASGAATTAPQVPPTCVGDTSRRSGERIQKDRLAAVFSKSTRIVLIRQQRLQGRFSASCAIGAKRARRGPWRRVGKRREAGSH